MEGPHRFPGAQQSLSAEVNPTRTVMVTARSLQRVRNSSPGARGRCFGKPTPRTDCVLKFKSVSVPEQQRPCMRRAWLCSEAVRRSTPREKEARGQDGIH